MPFVPLGRRFVPWAEGSKLDPDWLAYYGADGSLSWSYLLARRRVVVLAEAGSGKSEELKNQAAALGSEGKFVFEATLQSIGRRGRLADALGEKQTARLVTWKSSSEPAWFFFDSIDEAKATDYRFDEVLGVISDGLGETASRAFVVLSGRYADWEFRRDLARLHDRLPVPSLPEPMNEIDPDQLLTAILRGESRKKREKERELQQEKPIVVLMAALDASQVRLFVDGQGVEDVDGFVSAVEASDLWGLARRPLDLDWLVGYWRDHREFGSLSKMLELSLAERLREHNLPRDRVDPIDPATAGEALERIGAALVFGQVRDIAVPDTGVDLRAVPHAGLDLSRVLPDWSGDKRVKLINRSVFDPAATGLVRLHNDNEGVVRGYLTARWLSRLLKKSDFRKELRALLFAESYGRPVVRPAMRHTAAWLALDHPDIADEIIRREPALLLDGGDPGSLKLEVRQRTLNAIAQRVGGLRPEMPDRDALRRFSKPDLAATIRALWPAADELLKRLLCRIVELGRIAECRDLVFSAAADEDVPRGLRVAAIDAVLAVGDEEDKQALVELLRSRIAHLPPGAVWRIVEAEFPSTVDVPLFVAVARAKNNKKNRNDGLGLDYFGPRLVERLSSREELSNLIEGLQDSLERREVRPDEEELTDDEALLTTLEAAGIRLLTVSAPNEVPTAAIDVALRVGEHSRGRVRRREEGKSILERLQSTPDRRRTALWHAFERLRNRKGEVVSDTWDLTFLGYPPGIVDEDIAWLVEDVRSADSGRSVVAVNAAMRIWRQRGESPSLLQQIREAALDRPEVVSVIDRWTRPADTSDSSGEKTLRQLERKHQKRKEDDERPWLDFAERMRADPSPLGKIPPINPDAETIDGRIYNMWTVIRAASDDRLTYSVPDLTVLEPIFGEEAIRLTTAAFASMWRLHSPRFWPDEPDARNKSWDVDLMGLVGLGLEAASNPDLFSMLSSADAEKATKYAVLELNGFPVWLGALARAHPGSVRSVLQRAIDAEMDDLSSEHANVMRKAASDRQAAIVVAPHILNRLGELGDLHPNRLQKALEIIEEAALPSAKVIEMIEARLQRSSRLSDQVSLLSTLFRLAPEKATDLLRQMGESPTDVGATSASLTRAAITALGGGRVGGRDTDLTKIAPPLLEALVETAFDAIRIEDDNVHPTGEVYAYDERDDAEEARGRLFQRLIDIPGEESYSALLRLRSKNSFKVPTETMDRILHRRSLSDAELPPWAADEAFLFEQDWIFLPRTAADLHAAAVGKLEDLADDLVNGDFTQGRTLALLATEKDVQRWLADRLFRDRTRAYSVDREPHVADEKEPDIRFQAKASDAVVPIEVKVAESWSLAELERALEVQLVGQYLRDRNNRFGILLLIHSRPRVDGWIHPDGHWMTFTEVVSHLSEQAAEIDRRSGLAGRHAKVVAIDVSRFHEGPAKRKGRTAGARKARTPTIAKSGARRSAKK